MVDIILYSGGLPVDGRPRLQLLFLFYLPFQQQNALSTFRLPLHSSSAREEPYGPKLPLHW